MNRISRALLSMFLMAGNLLPLWGSAAAGPVDPPDPDRTAELAAELQSTYSARIAYHSATGKVRFIGALPDQPIRNPLGRASQATSEAAGLAFMVEYAPLFGLTDAASELQVLDVASEDDGRTIIHYRQVVNGIPVFGGEMLLHLNPAHEVITVIGEVLPDPTISVQPAISTAEARRIALGSAQKYYPQASGLQVSSEPQLWIYYPALIGASSGPTRLVWRVEVAPADGLQPIRELVLVDARTGALALHFNQIEYGLNRWTYDLNHSSSPLPGTLVCTESDPACSTGNSDAQSAHLYAMHTYNFYWSFHNRDSIDGAGMTIKSSVRYGLSYQNAFWNGSQMVYGDGYGFVHADDIVAHEITHGVTQYESGLLYYAQSGAINESFSDLWGEFVDQWNGTGTDTAAVKWLIGEDSTGMPNFWKRDMENPPGGGIYDTQPDKMSSPYYYVGIDDNGGVHTNSGINNKAAFLMTDGGSFNGYAITGLGLTKVAEVYYEAQTNLMTVGADYPDLYEALYQACLNRVGFAGITSGDCQQVRNATLAVEMNQVPAGATALAAICPTGLPFGTNLFQDGFESGSGNWSFSGSDVPHWSIQEDFPYTDAYSLWGDDFPDQISDSYAAMTSPVLLPPNAYLHFVHAYLFEEGNYDGGVLEYSTNNGATWLDAGDLIEENGYNGTISGGYGSPLAGRDAFTNSSLGANGYIATRVDLSSLSGWSVRFRWRMGLDSEFYNWGWFVDDVSIHTCGEDTLSPSVTIDRGQGYGDPTNLRPVVFRVTFSEPVTGFDAVDILVGGSAGATNGIVSETGPLDGTTYDVAISGMTGAGTVTLTFNFGAAGDGSGNPSLEPFVVDNSIDFIDIDYPMYLPLVVQ